MSRRLLFPLVVMVGMTLSGCGWSTAPNNHDPSCAGGSLSGSCPNPYGPQGPQFTPGPGNDPGPEDSGPRVRNE